MPSIRDSLPIGVCKLGGCRAHLPASTLPIGVRIMHRDELVVNAVPNEHGTCWYACHILGFDCRDRRSGARTRSIDAPLPIGVRGAESCESVARGSEVRCADPTCWCLATFRHVRRVIVRTDELVQANSTRRVRPGELTKLTRQGDELGRAS